MDVPFLLPQAVYERSYFTTVSPSLEKPAEPVSGENQISFRAKVGSGKVLIVFWHKYCRLTKNHRLKSINSQFKFLLFHLKHPVLSEVDSALLIFFFYQY